MRAIVATPYSRHLSPRSVIREIYKRLYSLLRLDNNPSMGRGNLEVCKSVNHSDIIDAQLYQRAHKAIIDTITAGLPLEDDRRGLPSIFPYIIAIPRVLILFNVMSFR